MTAEELEAFKKAWAEYPSQDNEGYVPDRGGFKAGFSEGVKWERERCAKIAHEIARKYALINRSNSAYERQLAAEEIEEAIRARSEGR